VRKVAGTAAAVGFPISPADKGGSTTDGENRLQHVRACVSWCAVNYHHPCACAFSRGPYAYRL